MKKYDLIYCDPPWDYKNKVSNGVAKNHYSTTSLFNLTHLSIHSIASDNAVLAMLYTGNFVLLYRHFFGFCQPLLTIENKKATSNLLMALGFLIFINYC